jgi:hypothetical protein
MKSIRYVLTKKPGNTDDCLDFAKHHQVNFVLLTLETSERATEMYILRSLVAVFCWQFDCPELPKVIIEKCLGGCIFHESEKKQKIDVDNANTRLTKTLERLEGAGMQVTGRDQRFAYDVIYMPDSKPDNKDS